MKRRTLDIIFSVGGLGFAVLLLILGLVLQSQANFASDYVRDQLAEQRIDFPAEYNRGETDVPGSDCLVEYAGQTLSTGSMSECYANFYIATHMAHSAEEAGVPGETYATMGAVIRQLNPETDGERIAELNALRDSMFRGETLRGLLLTTYGFSIFGDRAEQAATVAIIGAILLAILSIAGLIHAFITPKDKLALVPPDSVQEKA